MHGLHRMNDVLLDDLPGRTHIVQAGLKSIRLVFGAIDGNRQHVGPLVSSRELCEWVFRAKDLEHCLNEQPMNGDLCRV